MNIYDYVLEKIGGGSKSLTDLLLKKCGNSEKIMALSNDELALILNNSQVREDTITCFLRAKEDFVRNKSYFIGKYNNEIRKIREKYGIEIISLSDSGYPSQLKKIKGIPLNLYIKGNLEFDFDKSIAIVGTRNVSAFAKEKVAEISKDLAKQGFCIISGLARGVDGQAHSSTVALHKKTIAVLPFLTDKTYPPEHTQLAEEIILNDGAVISENFFFDKTYNKFLFTERNRIISGLSKAVLIIEGSQKSGSLSQYNHAVRQDKLILTLKPKVDYDGTFMPNKIIEEGGIAISSAKEIIDIFTSGDCFKKDYKKKNYFL